MPFIEIKGERPLHGEVDIQGSKNTVLPILAATLLVRGISKIHKCPKIRDVLHMIKILEEMGCSIVWEGSTVIVDTTSLNTTVVPVELAKSMRSSIILLGALLGREKEATISYPGGCAIGYRAIDFHLKAMQMLGAIIEDEDELIKGHTTGIVGTEITFEGSSVGATQNTILAAVLGEGITYIKNAAREPEVIHLCKFLNAAGAMIQGAGTGEIVIKGVDRLYDTEYTNVPDRIVAGTLMAAVLGTGGSVVINGTDGSDLGEVIHVLRAMGQTIIVKDYTILVSSYMRPKPIPYIETRPYPGFPTDMQSQILSVLMKADGTSRVKETIFNDRFHNVKEQIKFGGSITVEDNMAIIDGVPKLKASEVYASELRGGAALVIAGLMAEGRTKIYNPHFIERGYEDICRDFRNLGADIRYHD